MGTGLILDLDIPLADSRSYDVVMVMRFMLFSGLKIWIWIYGQFPLFNL
jgi:hypothetical protein